jgi:5-hydroxyisourate hydrolase
MRRNTRATRRLARFASHLGVSDELHHINNAGENAGGTNWSLYMENTSNSTYNYASSDDLSTNSCSGDGNGNGSGRQITITSHVLDTNIGRPAAGVRATLERKLSNSNSSLSGWEEIASGKTDNDGRIKTFPVLPSLGSYRVNFETGDYFVSKGMEKPFYGNVVINFEVQSQEHYHIPLLLAPHGYSTYRGS